MKSSALKHRIKAIVEQYDPRAEVYLYGSRARGTSEKYSDWDILILLDENQDVDLLERKISNELFDLEFDTGEVISPGIYSKSEWENKFHITPYHQNVMKEAQQI